MTPLRQSLLFLLSLLIFSVAAIAHRDTPIKLKGADLIGLPSEYEPAKFDKATLTLSVGKQSVQFGNYVQSLLHDSGEYEVAFSASWYHKSSLPSYLLVRFAPKGKDFTYEFLFNLRSLELMDATLVLRFQLPADAEPFVESYRRFPIVERDALKELIEHSAQISE